MKHVLKLLAELDNTLIAGVKVNPIRSPNKEKAGILSTSEIPSFCFVPPENIYSSFFLFNLFQQL